MDTQNKRKQPSERRKEKADERKNDRSLPKDDDRCQKRRIEMLKNRYESKKMDKKMVEKLYIHKKITLEEYKEIVSIVR